MPPLDASHPRPSTRPANRPGTPRARHLVPLLGTLALAQGCAPSIDLRRVTDQAQRMTYEALRREDCRLNQLDEFCQRTFANEYVEYDRLRRRFIRESTEGTWRVPPPEDNP